jgi:hypothetical protein
MIYRLHGSFFFDSDVWSSLQTSGRGVWFHHYWLFLSKHWPVAEIVRLTTSIERYAVTKIVKLHEEATGILKHDYNYFRRKIWFENLPTQGGTVYFVKALKTFAH